MANHQIHSLAEGELIKAYIDRYANMYNWEPDGVLKKNDANFWAVEKLSDLVRSTPEVALNLILKILETTTNNEVLDNLSAGPLEDLILLHGDAMINQIEFHAINDERFQDLLNGVWMVGSPLVWERIVKCRSATDGRSDEV